MYINRGQPNKGFTCAICEYVYIEIMHLLLTKHVILMYECNGVFGGGYPIL
jgi:hypothetical protein